MRRWLLAQQSTREHPFTHAAPGRLGVDSAERRSAGRGRYVRRPRCAAAAWRSGSAIHHGGWGRRPLVAGRAEPERRYPDVLPRVGNAPVRSEHSGNHRARAAGVERLVPPSRSTAAARRTRGRGASRGVPRGHAADGWQLDPALVWQRTRAGRGQSGVRNGARRSRPALDPRSRAGSNHGSAAGSRSRGCWTLRTRTEAGEETAESRRRSRKRASCWPPSAVRSMMATRVGFRRPWHAAPIGWRTRPPAKPSLHRWACILPVSGHYEELYPLVFALEGLAGARAMVFQPPAHAIDCRVSSAVE